ncbi:hypothetical protein G9A89_002335 [Geosiphon pyriformis]|nr:hypothetical protein G9A89_002335 [Geosiphon pyriformis]
MRDLKQESQCEIDSMYDIAETIQNAATTFSPWSTSHAEQQEDQTRGTLKFFLVTGKKWAFALFFCLLLTIILFSVIDILYMIVIANAYHNERCQKLLIKETEPLFYEYDPSKFMQLNVTTNDYAASHNFNSIGTTKLLTLTETKSVWSFWKREFWDALMCAQAKIYVYLPQNEAPEPKLLFNFEEFDVTILPNETPYLQSELDIRVVNGNIELKNFSAKTASLSTNDGGKIHGTVINHTGIFLADTKSGSINLDILTSPSAVYPKIELKSAHGDISLRLNGTFSGDFDLSTNSGYIDNINLLKNITLKKNHKNWSTGHVITPGPSSKNGSLFIDSNAGNIFVDFDY